MAKELKHEWVLVVDAKVLNEFRGLDDGPITTLRADIDRIVGILGRSFFMARSEAEEAPEYKQVIPYLIISSGSTFLTYRRSGSEKRLTDLVSIGIGGHINLEDSDERKLDVIKKNVRREVSEELRLVGVPEFWQEFPDCFATVGILYDGSDDVGRVHLGIVLRCDVSLGTAQKIRLTNEGKDLEWKTLKELEAGYEHLEGWSQICVKALPSFCAADAGMG